MISFVKTLYSAVTTAFGAVSTACGGFLGGAAVGKAATQVGGKAEDGIKKVTSAGVEGIGAVQKSINGAVAAAEAHARARIKRLENTITRAVLTLSADGSRVIQDVGAQINQTGEVARRVMVQVGTTAEAEIIRTGEGVGKVTDAIIQTADGLRQITNSVNVAVLTITAAVAAGCLYPIYAGSCTMDDSSSVCLASKAAVTGLSLGALTLTIVHIFRSMLPGKKDRQIPTFTLEKYLGKRKIANLVITDERKLLISPCHPGDSLTVTYHNREAEGVKIHIHSKELETGEFWLVKAASS